MKFKLKFLTAALVLAVFAPGLAADKAEKLTGEVKAHIDRLNERFEEREWRELQKSVTAALKHYESRVEDLEEDVEKLSRKLDKKSKGRYPIEVEFALVYECIFSVPGVRNMNQDEYQKLAACCAESVEKIQERIPKYSEFHKVEQTLNAQCAE